MADSAATFHSTPSPSLVYYKSRPLLWERISAYDLGRRLEVESIGKLNLVVRCDEDVRITLVDVDVTPGLVFNLTLVHRISDFHDVTLNATSASLLGGRIKLKKNIYGVVPSGFQGAPELGPRCDGGGRTPPRETTEYEYQ